MADLNADVHVDADLEPDDDGVANQDDAQKPKIPTKRGQLRTIPNMFSDSKPTIVFEYPEYCGENRPQSAVEPTIFVACEESKDTKITFCFAEDVWRYNCIINGCKRNGLYETSNMFQWNIYWGKYLPADQYAEMLPFQRANHFPGSLEVGHKGKLLANLNRMRRLHGNQEYDFVPESFSLPRDQDSFERAFHIAAAASGVSSSSSSSKKSASKDKDVNEPIWIAKPPNSSCGRGIFLITKLSELPKDKNCVISRYIANPFLINKRKFDLRIYACVTSLLPLRIYLYEDGLARFCTKEFDLKRSNLKKRYMHLTNFSVNKKNAEFERNQNAEQTDAGSKWSFTALLDYLQKNGLCEPSVMIDRISDVIIKTFIAAEPNMASVSLRLNCPPSGCFEMFGFDILLDDSLRPWIMEVNCWPSLSSSSPMDKKIKTELMCDVFHLIGVEPIDIKEYMKHEKKDEDLKARRKWMGLEKDENSSSFSSFSKEHVTLSLPDLQKYFEKIYTSQATSSSTSSSLSSSSVSTIATSTSAQIAVEKLLARCSLADWSLLRRFEEENARVGHFTRIFPTPSTHARYGHLFETQRFSNLLTALYLRLPKPHGLSLLSLASPSAILSSPVSVTCSSNSTSSSTIAHVTPSTPTQSESQKQRSSFRPNTPSFISSPSSSSSSAATSSSPLSSSPKPRLLSAQQRPSSSSRRALNMSSSEPAPTDVSTATPFPPDLISKRPSTASAAPSARHSSKISAQIVSNSNPQVVADSSSLLALALNEQLRLSTDNYSTSLSSREQLQQLSSRLVMNPQSLSASSQYHSHVQLLASQVQALPHSNYPAHTSSPAINDYIIASVYGTQPQKHSQQYQSHASSQQRQHFVNPAQLMHLPSSNNTPSSHYDSSASTSFSTRLPASNSNSTSYQHNLSHPRRLKSESSHGSSMTASSSLASSMFAAPPTGSSFAYPSSSTASANQSLQSLNSSSSPNLHQTSSATSLGSQSASSTILPIRRAISQQLASSHLSSNPAIPASVASSSYTLSATSSSGARRPISSYNPRQPIISSTSSAQLASSTQSSQAPSHLLYKQSQQALISRKTDAPPIAVAFPFRSTAIPLSKPSQLKR